jgi:hypothetical protein
MEFIIPRQHKQDINLSDEMQKKRKTTADLFPPDL